MTTTNTTVPISQPRMLTVAQAAERLGLSPMTVRGWIFRRKVAYVKLGRSVRIAEAEIDRLLRHSTVPARVA